MRNENKASRICGQMDEGVGGGGLHKIKDAHSYKFCTWLSFFKSFSCCSKFAFRNMLVATSQHI